jgi:hypothetical protein
MVQDYIIHNNLICNYYGDVTTAGEDLQSKVDELQGQLNKAKRDDPNLDQFKKELDDINWGKEELDKIEPPDEAESIREVIAALNKRLTELEQSDNGE